MNEHNLSDCDYAIRQLHGIVIGNDATHDRVRRALDALERIKGRLESAKVAPMQLLDPPLPILARCGALVDGVTGEPR